MTILIREPRERIRFFRFLVVGTIGAFVDFGVMNLLVNLFKAPLVLAGSISFIAAVLSNFIWNRHWTYPDSRSKPIIQQLMQFALVNVAGLLIRIPILWGLEPILYKLILAIPISILNENAYFLSDNLTLAIAVIIVLFWNFFVNRYWTYSDV